MASDVSCVCLRLQILMEIDSVRFHAYDAIIKHLTAPEGELPSSECVTVSEDSNLNSM